MNLLPLLLAAVAVLLSAAALFKVLGAAGAKTDSDASARKAALEGEVAKLGGQLDAIREAVIRMPEMLDALPARIAQASGTSDLLSEVRSGREVSQRTLEHLDAVRLEVHAGTTTTTSGLDRLRDGVATLDRSLGQNLASSRESADRIETAIAQAGERAQSLAAGGADSLGVLSDSLAPLPGLVSSVVERLGSLDHAAVLAEQLDSLRQANDLARSHETALRETRVAIEGLASSGSEATERDGLLREALVASGNEFRDALKAMLASMAEDFAKTREILQSLPARTAEEIATRPAPAPELEELAIAVRDAGALRGDSVRSIADAVSRVAERLEASSEDGRSARQDAADRLSQSLAILETVASGVREALLPLGEALRGHGEAVVPVVKGLETAQDRFEEAAVSMRVNQVEFAASVGAFTSAAQDLSSGLGAFAREGLEDVSRDPAAVQQALLEALDRLLGGFSESLRATLVEADLRHREALVEIAARLPGGAQG